MAGTRESGLAARDTNLARDPEYYRKLGEKGGKVKTTKPKGMAYLKATGQMDKLKAISIKGGRISRRGKSVRKAL